MRATYLGGTCLYGEAAWGGAVGSDGNIFIVGETTCSENEGFPLQNAIQPTHGDPGGKDSFVAKLSSDLSTLHYSTFLGGEMWDRAAAVAVDLAGDAYVVGRTESLTFPVVNPLPAQSTLPGTTSAFVSKISDASGGTTVIQFAQTIYVAPDEGSNPPFGPRAVITVTRSGDLTNSTTVDYIASDGSATQPADYLATSGTLPFGPGEQAQAFVVPLVDDELPEGTETINLRLSNPTGGAVLGSLPTAQIAIEDNDGLIRTVIIRDRVGAGPNWTITENVPWLTFSSSSGTGPSSITATASVTGLPPGTYEDFVIVEGDTGDSPQFVQVILRVVQK